nr:hypothetical protein [Tanacetum cinerariifolium]
MQNPEDISDPTTAIYMTLALMAKAFTLNNTTLTNTNQRSSSNLAICRLHNRDSSVQNAVQNPGIQIVKNINGLSVVSIIANQYGKINVVTTPVEGNGNGINGNLIRCYNYRGEGIQSTQEEFKFMAAADAYEETERVKVNCILENNLQQASTSGTQSDKAPVYDSNGSAEVHLSKNYYDNDMFNMFTQEEQYTELLEPILEPHQVPQNDSNVISEVSSVEQGRGTVEQHSANVKETRATSKQMDTTKGTSVNTQFRKQLILKKPPSFYGSKLYSVTPLPKSKVFPKYVNGIKSRKKNQSGNVLKSENQKKHKANVKKSKKSRSKESLASPRKRRSFLRWLPTGRIFNLCGKITSPSNTERKSDTSVFETPQSEFMYLSASCLLNDSRTSLSQPCPDAVAIFLTSSPDRSRRCRFMHATSSPDRSRKRRFMPATLSPCSTHISDSYEAPPEEFAKDKGIASEVSASIKKKGRTVAITAENMQKRKNDVKAKTTLLLAFPNEHQLRFSKYDSAKELWEAILKNFGGNEATKKTKKNQLKQQYVNFKAEGSETLEQTFNRLQAIDVSRIDDDDIEEMDIKWNLALLSMRADRFWKKTDHQGVKTEGRERESYKKDPKEDEASNNHALVADEQEEKHKKNLNTKISKLNEELSDCETDLYNYKRGLSQVEARLVEFKENEIKYFEKIRVLERDIELKDNKIEYLRDELEEKDLSWMGLPKFVDDTVTNYTRPTTSIDVSKSPMIKFVKESGCPNATKVNNNENARKPTVKYAEMYRNTSQSPKVRENQRNWNNQKPQQLGKDFMMQNKACYNCGSFDHLEFNCKHDLWMNKRKTWTRVKNKVWAPTVRPKIPTIGSKVLTAKPTVAVDKGNKGKAVKALALGFRNLSKILLVKDNIDDKGYWNSGCSRHMTGNISYLSEYEPFNGGYVSFGHRRGKITDFKLVDDKHVLLRTPRQQNMYTIDLKNVVPHKNFNLSNWSNLVKGLPFKSFENDNSCVACLKGKQHKASFVTDDFSRFSWTFFLKSKDETSRILRNFITKIENLKDLNVKIIISDNEGEFRKKMHEFCSWKGIKREFSNTRTPQQNGVAERRNMTLIKAARTMLADAKLPVTFWAEAVNTACYVQNRVLMIKPHNKTPYELFNERSLL